MSHGLQDMTRLRSGCKINLFLRIGERLPSGMHSLKSLFLPLDEPCDFLELREVEGKARPRVRFLDAATGEALNIDPDDNTLIRAAAWHAARTGHAPALDIRVQKRVPIGAGLGGGSANAAALLLYLRQSAARKAITPLPMAQLRRESACIGADVPFFLQAGPARVWGVGERMRPCLNPFAGQFLLLLCPRDISVSTSWAFAELDKRRRNQSPARPLSPSLARQTAQSRAARFRAGDYGNDFEEVVFEAYPALAELRRRLTEAGAGMARMSGTGSSLFGLFADEKIAADAAKTLASRSVSVYMQPLPARKRPETDAGV